MADTLETISNQRLAAIIDDLVVLIRKLPASDRPSTQAKLDRYEMEWKRRVRNKTAPQVLP